MALRIAVKLNSKTINVDKKYAVWFHYKIMARRDSMLSVFRISPTAGERKLCDNDRVVLYSSCPLTAGPVQNAVNMESVLIIGYFTAD